ncbi:6-carboxytetrahydropterin synthase QueD [Bacillus atrophaeus]|jgi:6-pyruvoyltetrahydropterin/6-carboxytetrahydropterin synthase|uniref:6-carboxytetrahydropterin synthase QueD n=1 Tax=Bacillus atrophaeus TaxID=1452 RepID=UPI0022819424|nr:6-carboxytetrahydropterin synthase QueD [Bacillus atrophaeus]MCY8487033.1 6-carboxytetrahydropterin synthase QueD [Bacillus atrophaeus]MCY8490933.1 6-carboxytetrahydropterin synthase QueD [Bacillus atrophaeus]MCY8817814.1 6-carboxytetrahydropterin synthase QueD [Bacillus atrophaeus]
MAKNEVTICKTFSFDSAHQLVNHKGKCANLHGHTYKLEVKLKMQPNMESNSTDEGFVIDFSDLKKIIKDEIIDKFDHAFIAQGNEPAYEAVRSSGTKICVLGFRTTVENLALFICWRLMEVDLPVYSIRLWETPTGWAEVLSEDVPKNGPYFLT